MKTRCSDCAFTIGTEASMGTTTPLTDKITELYRQGFTIREVATRIGLSPYTVLLRLHEAGVKMRSKGRGTLVTVKLDRKVLACLSRISPHKPAAAIFELISDAYFEKTGEAAPIEKQRPV